MSYPLRIRLQAPHFEDGPGRPGISAGIIADRRYEPFRATAPGPEQYDLDAPISAGPVGEALERLMQLGPPAPWHQEDEPARAKKRRRARRPSTSRETLRMEAQDGR